MKKFLLSLSGLLFLTLLHAQDVPHGMKYQAVARDARGAIIADKDISLKVNLFSGNLKNPVIHYSEIHTVKTNQLGLFSLEIGSGSDVTPGKVVADNKDLSTQTKSGSNFDKVPWSTEEIWMEVAVKDNGSDFITISSSKLLTVPYAFHARTAGKLDPVADPTPVLEDREWKWDNRCECHGGLRAITLLYLGPSGVKIRAYDNDDLRKQDLVDSFLNVQNGDVIRLNAQPRPDHALKGTTWMQILAGNTSTSTVLSLINMPTDCDQRSIGENFGNFSVLSQVDKRDSAVCSICDVRMEWKLDGNAVFDLCNYLGTKSHHDLRIITNNLERIVLSADNKMTIHDSLIVDQERPTLLTGKLTVDQETELGRSLRVEGATDLQSSLNVNMNSPTWLTGTLRVDGATDINNSFNVNLQSPTLLTGTLRAEKDALFKEHVLLDNPIQSNSTTTGALVVSGGLGLGGNLNIGGNAKFGGATEFQGIVTITNGSQSTATTNGALIVTGGVGIGKRLNVGGQTDLSGVLNVNGAASLKDVTQSDDYQTGALIVSGGAGIAKNLNVAGATNITGATTIAGLTTINNSMNVNVGLGQVKINGNFSGVDGGVYSYPLVVEGAKQGIWVKVNSTEATSANNFMTFQDGDGTINGRIEGQNQADLENEPEYKNWNTQLIFSIAINTGLLAKDILLLGAAIAGSTPCVGFGACFTIPPPAQIVAAAACVVISTAKLAQAVIAYTDYKDLRTNHLGVTYVSKGADYAEWLPKANPAENFRPGDVVGVKGGFISRVTSGAEKIMVISNKPIVLGNSPSKENESTFKMVAFMGQVPVAVYGKVEKGDYIIASGLNDGFGKAVSGSAITVEDYKNLVGIAWSGAKNVGVNYVNVAVGIGDRQVSTILEDQEKSIDKIAEQLNAQIAETNKTNELLAKLVPGFTAPKGEPVIIAKPTVTSTRIPDPPSPLTMKPLIKPENIDPPFTKADPRFIYFKLSRTEVEQGILLAEHMIADQGGDVEQFKLFADLKDPAVKEKFIDKFLIEFDKNFKLLQKGSTIAINDLDKQVMGAKTSNK